MSGEGLLAFKPLLSYRSGSTSRDLINAGTLMLLIVPENEMKQKKTPPKFWEGSEAYEISRVA